MQSPTHSDPTPMGLRHVLLWALIVAFFYYGYGLILLPAIELHPQLAPIKPGVDACIAAALFVGGVAFLYAAMFSPDTLIDKFRKSSLFEAPASLRRIVTRASFLMAGLLLVAISITILIGALAQIRVL